MIVTQINILAEKALSFPACLGLLAQASRTIDVTTQPVADPPDFSYFLMNLLSLGSLCLLLITGGLIVRHISRQRDARRAFNLLSGKAQLTDQQGGLVWDLYNAIELGDMNELFDDEEIFRQAVAVYMGRLRKSGLNEDNQAKTIGLAQDLFARMGFENPAGRSARNILSTCQFLPGEKIFLSPADDSEDIQASIVRNDIKGLVLNVRAKSAVKPGQWRGNFDDHGYLWEFLSAIEAMPDGRLVLSHCDNLRLLNRRAFPRIPTNRPAMVAGFDLTQPVASVRMPEFVPCRLVEIAGPGLKIITDAKFEIGRRILVLVELAPGRVTGGTAKVRRIMQEETGKNCLVVELVGLTESELAELTCITNETARAKMAKEEE
ncbi:MAG: PilZ domain-containing protein [Planctomycetes bacterium]|nr:PilZ domain-containing protein [Planctomycetota bacterium]